MAKKPHIKLNSAIQKEPSEKLKFNYGIEDRNKRDAREDADYSIMAAVFRTSLAQFRTDITVRRQERNPALKVPKHIDYIRIEFQDQFNIPKYYQNWYNEFGLMGVNFSYFNREVLFAVENQSKFDAFLRDIQNFIRKESGIESELEYSSRVRFIRDFQLHTTQDILNYEEQGALMNIKLIEFPAGSSQANTIYTRLEEYLSENELEYRLFDQAGVLELYDAQQETIEEISKNFDIVLNITSSLSTVVRPTELNTVQRDYGFEIVNGDDENLPIIGIMDTGISNTTPLSKILINDERFNLTASSPLVDNVDNGLGHGTSVGALAALGRKPYYVNYSGEISADARLLSMKILDSKSGYLSMVDVVNMLHDAKSKYPEIKFFVLTTCYARHKRTNEDYSMYAYELDKFAHENDCLIFICTANNKKATNQPGYDLTYFNREETNLSPPAESRNNVTVGAAADNLKNGAFLGISKGREFPTLYTRKCHLKPELFKKPNKRFTKYNPHLFKPDVIESGGDYEQGQGFVGTKDVALIEVLSANPAWGFYKDAGTSFSTPLVANLAAQIQRKYPSLKSQTVKALIINGASLDVIQFDESLKYLINKTAGHGIVDPEKSLDSSDNTITLVIEDEINPEEMKVVPLNFPDYLTNEDLGKKRGLLHFTATLCFSFDPVIHNHLAYSPIQLAFAVFRNKTGEDILKPENEVKAKLKKIWQ